MSYQTPATDKESHTGKLDSLTVARRRRIVEILGGYSNGVSVRTLAVELTAVPGRPADAPADGAIERYHTRLRHVDLPKLSEAGLITLDDDEQTVALADDEVFDDPLVAAILETDDDDRARVFAERRCRQLLAVFETSGERRQRAQLAQELATERAPPAPDENAVRSIEIDLHHCLLPKLAAAGLVAYDEETVEYTGPSDLLNVAVADEEGAKSALTADGGTDVTIP